MGATKATNRQLKLNPTPAAPAAQEPAKAKGRKKGR
jgi:hypothetical protein